MRLKTFLGIAGLHAGLILAACDNASGIEISQSQFKDEWPFTVGSGRLECVPPSKVIFHANGATYAVNGLASGDKRYKNIRPIWKDNPDIPGTKINIGPIIDRGLKLCS